MERILNIKYFSQHDPSVPEDWRNTVCGIACVKMCIDSLCPKESASAKDLIGEGVLLKGYTEGGWMHESLVIMLRNHGLVAYRQEFKSHKVDLQTKSFEVRLGQRDLVDEGIDKITRSVDSGKPVIVSVKEGFADNICSHLVLIVGFKFHDERVDGFYIHDPDSRNGGEKKNKFVNLEYFKSHWKKLAIFTG